MTVGKPIGQFSPAETVVEEVDQIAHGFTVGQVVRFDTGAWVLALADTEANALGLGIVSEVVDVNNFSITHLGFIDGLSGLVADSLYFLDDVTPGLLTLTPPTIRKEMFFAFSTTSGFALQHAIRPPAGASDGAFRGLGLWRYRTEITSTPAAGRLQFDNVIVDNATELFVNVINDGGTDLTAFLSLLAENDLIYIQVQDNATQFIVVSIGGEPTLSAGVFTFPIGAVESQGAAITNNATVAVVAIHSADPIELDEQIAEATSLASTTSGTPIDLNAMSLTTSNTVAKKYWCHFDCNFANNEEEPGVFSIVVDGVTEATRRAVPGVAGSVSQKPNHIGVQFLTGPLGTGIIIKVQFHRENENTLEVANRSLIIQGVSQ